MLKTELETCRRTIRPYLLLLLTVSCFGILTLFDCLPCLGASEDPVRARGSACWEQTLQDCGQLVMAQPRMAPLRLLARAPLGSSQPLLLPVRQMGFSPS